MKNFLKAIKKFFLKLFSLDFLVFFILISLWLFSLTDNLLTLSIQIDEGYIKGYINNQKWGEIKTDIKKIENLEIDIEHSNLPKPFPFKPKLLGLKFLDEAGKVVYQTDSLNIQLPVEIQARAVQIKLKNCLFAEIKFNRQPNSYYYFLYRPFRERDTELAFIKNDKYLIGDHRWRDFYLPIPVLIKYFLKIIFLPFPLLTIIYLVQLLQTKTKPLKKLKEGKSLQKNHKERFQCFVDYLIPFLLICMFAYLIFINVKYVEKIPHDPDSVQYLWAAKYLAKGRLWLPIPSDFFKAHWEFKGRWISLYNYGHSLVLSIGVLLGMPWVIPPLVGTLFLYFLYSFLKNVTGKLVALLTVTVAFFSPQFQMHAVNFMSHNSAIFFLIFFFYALLEIFQNKVNKFISFFGGVLFCFLAQTRPLTAAVVTPVITLLIFVMNFKKGISLSKYLSLVVGFFSFLMLFFFVNYLTYGDIIKTAHNQFNLPKFTWMKSGKTIRHGLTDSLSFLLVMRLLILPGLPNLFAFLILLSFLNKELRGLTLMCFGCIFLIALGVATYDDPWGIFLGSRFWHEMLPFIFIIFAISFDFILRVFKKIGFLIIITITLGITLKGISGWILGKEKLWENMIYFTPNNIKELKGFNYTDARLIKEAKKQNIHNAIIFVKDCGGNWWCYGSVVNENSINLNGDTIWAHDLKEKNRELMKIYPDRKYFLADYEQNTIIPISIF